MEKRQLNFDVSRGGIQHRLFVRVGDLGSRTVESRFFSGREALAVNAANIRILRPDGTEILGACAVSDNKVLYTFTGGEDVEATEESGGSVADLAVGGEYVCEYILYGEDGAVMTSPQFAVVASDVAFSGEGARSSNSYPALLSALAKLQEGNFTVEAVSGDTASATATVGDTAIHIDFVLPKGEKGDTGATGAQGAQGEKGDAFTYSDFTDEQLAALKGDKGDKGEKGDTGETGAQGPQGEKGETGPQGEKGADGSDYVLTDNDKSEILYLIENDMLMYQSYIEEEESVKYQMSVGGILHFETEEAFQAFKQRSEDGSGGVHFDGWFGGAQNILCFVNGVARALWVGFGSLYDYSEGRFLDIKSPEAIKDEIKAYIDEAILGGAW